MPKTPLKEAVDALIAKDPRYPVDAYEFVRETLDYTLRIYQRQDASSPRHVSGRELLEGFRRLALEEFGPMVLTVLDYWNVRSTEDVGEIVFNMVESGILGKTDEDKREDFKGVFDFDEAFRRPFVPALARRAVRKGSKTACAQSVGTK
ncbi:MAG: hypothetical protein PHV34_00620 [Verrucomicrobiae bacterium]|nr:hypothetical protein [Verrucomicrobiae bacterium]